MKRMMAEKVEPDSFKPPQVKEGHSNKTRGTVKGIQISVCLG